MRQVDAIIQDEGLELHDLSRDEYVAMAVKLIGENEDIALKIRHKGQVGKVQWFVGQMMRQGEGNVVAKKAETVLKDLFGLDNRLFK